MVCGKALLDYKSTKSRNKWNFVENKQDITQHLLKKTFPCCLNTQNGFIEKFYYELLRTRTQVCKMLQME